MLRLTEKNENNKSTEKLILGSGFLASTSQYCQSRCEK